MSAGTGPASASVSTAGTAPPMYVPTLGMNSETNPPNTASGIASPVGTPTATITARNPRLLITVSSRREYR